MSGAKQIRAAELLRTKAVQKELENDYDVALELHVKAAEAFLELANTAKDNRARSIYTTAAGKSLDRVREIKKVKTDVKPIALDPWSAQVQQFLLDKSSSINTIKYPMWDNADSNADSGKPSSVFSDPDGQPPLGIIPQAGSIAWRRPSMVWTRPLRMLDDTLSAEDVIQSVVTNCSVVAAISVCIQHGKKFGSKLIIRSLYPQGSDGLPQLSDNGKYILRVFINGGWRKVMIDDSLPFSSHGQLIGLSTGRNQILWPPLIEKAYMKLMGGYDFPGSNSGVDLHTLTGWIPEHVLIRSAQFRKEGTWTRIFKGYTRGLCLATLGTPPVLSEPMSVKLLPAHSYAVIDMEDNEEDQYITLLNPWCHRASEPSLDSSKSSKLRLGWREIYTYFDTIHLSWNPALFSNTYYFHGVWKATPSCRSTASGVVSNRLRLTVKTGAKRDIWILLTRHIINKQEPSPFISLNVYSRDAEPPLMLDRLSGVYADSIHVLKRLVSVGDSITVISSLEKGDVDVRYTITVYSDVEIAPQPDDRIGLYPKTITGTFTNKTSGGNHTYPTFMNNPQYRLTIHPKGTGNDNVPSLFYFCMQGSKDMPLNVKIAWSNGQRLIEPTKGDILIDSGAYSYGVAYGEKLLKPNQYTLIVSTFEPRLLGNYDLHLHSGRHFDIELLPQEGVGMYPRTFQDAWKRHTAAGSRKFGRYLCNPLLKVTIPSPMTIMVRLQRLDPNPSTAINLAMFTTRSSGDIDQEILNSGGYSDAVSGVLIKRTSISVGDSASGIEVSWLRH